MPTTTLGIPYPALTDLPDGPSQGQSLAAWLDAYLTARAAAIAANTAAIATNTAAIAGHTTTLAAAAHCYFTQTTGQTIPNGSGAFTTIVGWTAVESVGMGAITTGNQAISMAGMYVITGQVAIPPVVTVAGQFVARLYVNANIVDEVARQPDSVVNTALKFSHAEALAAGDTVHVAMLNTQGFSQPLATTDGLCHWSMTRTGPA